MTKSFHGLGTYSEKEWIRCQATIKFRNIQRYTNMADNKIEWVEREYKGKKETFALRRSFDGWRVVYPMKNADGTTNWKNIILGGSWGNMLRWLMILALILLFFYVYNNDTSVCRETLSNIGEVCQQYNTQQKYLANPTNFTFNLSNYEFPTP